MTFQCICLALADEFCTHQDGIDCVLCHFWQESPRAAMNMELMAVRITHTYDAAIG